MIAQVQKWGNSLALRIPRSLAKELGLEQNSVVEIRQEEGRLILSPVKPSALTLAQLLEQVTPDNLHTEVDTGRQMGREVW
ncbi:MAG TPA: AbrB/MazE/SpoVT family DNA-binding domain-containing protein [Caldilineaceae bacterium]|nr:AbrB/MazE/SpoVT family DNA-binding domain-containing protein [Caldilineaceae bacterium]